MLINSQPWEEILDHYKQQRNMTAMTELVTIINNDPAKFEIMAAVFIDELLISQFHGIELFSDCIHVIYKSENDLFEISDYRNNRIVWQEKLRLDELKKQFRTIAARTKLNLI